MRKIVWFTAMMFSFIGCDDLFVEDLSGMEIKWIIPNENVLYPAGNIELWWDEIEGMNRVELEIVRPNFDFPLEVILDTTITGNDKLLWSFSPGSYELRIRPCNNATCGDWKYSLVTVDSMIDLSNQQVILLTPLDSFYSSNFANEFTWLPLFGADAYQWSIIDNQTQAELVRDTTASNKFNYTFLSEGVYRWRVKALSQQFGPSNFQSRVIFIDTTKPPIPVQTFPLSNSNVVAGNVNFQWNGTQGVESYRVQISSDTTGLGFLLNATTSANSFSFEITSQGLYFWRISAEDRAGNSSPYSEWIEFSI